MQVFKAKWFARYARRERIADRSLNEAIERAEWGLVDADLDGGIVKRRVGRVGQVRSGGFRTLIAYRAGRLAVFLYAFARERAGELTDDELTLRDIGAAWLGGGPPARRSSPRRRSVAGGDRMAKKAQPSRLARALRETADDMRRAGVMDTATHRKITLRHLGEAVTAAEPITGDEIRPAPRLCF